MDPDPAIFVINLQDANKKQISFSAYYFLKVHLHNFSNRHLILSVPLSLVRMMTSGWPLQPSYSDRPGDQDGGVAPARNQGNPGCLDISQGQPLPEKALKISKRKKSQNRRNHGGFNTIFA
jgi:hypothetical protein